MASGGWEQKDVVPILIRGLGHKHEEIRRQAARGLNGRKDPTAFAALLKAAQGDTEKQVQCEAIRALSGYGDLAVPAIPILIQLIEKEVSIVDEICPLSIPAAEALVELGEKAIKPLHLLATNPRKREAVRSLALWSLERMAQRKIPNMKETVPGILPLLKNNSHDLRMRTLYLLGTIGKDAEIALPELMEFLRIATESEQAGAAKAMYLISKKPEPGLSILLNTLQSKDANVRAYSATSISDIGTDAKTAIPQLLTACRDGDSNVRLQAVRALGSMGILPREAISVLRECLKDQDKYVQNAVVRVLSKQK